jgi:hypothetical protein
MKQLMLASLLLAIEVVSAGDRIEFECNSNIVKSIKYVKEDSRFFHSLEYFPPKKDEITGLLYHDLEVTGGRCFDLIIRGQQNMFEYVDMVKLSNSPTPKTMKPDFKNLHLCQDIAMQRMIQYQAREPYQYMHGDVSEVGDSMEKSGGGQLTCYHRVRIYQQNNVWILFWTWLSGSGPVTH